MPKTNSLQHNNRNSNGLLSGPAYHKSGYEVIRILKQALDNTECAPGQHLEQKQFGYLLGVSKSTIHDWFHGDLVAPVQSFLCAFERMSETERILILREICRPCPRLEHPRLSHDASALSRLRNALELRAGLTIVLGSAEPRTFLVTALGHSINRVHPARRACGLDVNKPENFVPVAGVYYCRQRPTLEQTRSLVQETLEKVNQSEADLVIFNGVSLGMSQYSNHLLRLATNRHLVVADNSSPAIYEIMKVGINPAYVITVSLVPGRQGLIHVDFRMPEVLSIR
jgi:hypothetical protein